MVVFVALDGGLYRTIFRQIMIDNGPISISVMKGPDVSTTIRIDKIDGVFCGPSDFRTY